jgi:hypothetical protein
MVEFLGEIVAGAVLLVVSTLGAYIFNFFKQRKKTINDNSKEIAVLRDDIFALKRVMVIVAKRLDNGSRKYHDDLDSEYEELVKDLLTHEILRSDNRCPI